MALVMRITCTLTWIIDYYDRHTQVNDDELSYDTDCDDSGHRRLARCVGCLSSDTIIKVMTTLVYTQMLLQQLPVGDSWPVLLGAHSQQSLLRLAQCFGLGINYFYSLYVITADEYDWR
ncbi:unnamed protein product [Oppiella nova]|uniref:Uncharacterized protein n=1 Tax=Oppiella nova TaxID=334625 RepID=A0A7R9QR84_9ACAR|nr:unnamed protein product [Oppiella nova]CAG2171401.1 unnamed protein product [Oppiella nova]